VDGPGVVAELQFTAIALGTSPVDFSSSELRDPDNQSIPHNTGGASVRVTREGNDCDNPYVITEFPYFVDDTSCNYTNEIELDETDCTGHTTYGADVVYQFTMPGDGWGFFVDVPYAYWNTSLYILTQCDPPNCFVGSDQGEAGEGEAIYTTDLQGGVTYYIVVDGRDSTDCGEYNLGLQAQIGIEEGQPIVGIGPSGLMAVPSVSRDMVDIRFELGSPTPVELKVINQAGSLVREILSHSSMSGPQSYTWDTRNQYGRNVPMGTYFIHLRTSTSITYVTISVVR
jgi:hypothetical protein